MKSLLLLWQRLARECADRCHTSTARDFKTVTSRVEGEGVSFLTITLSNFCKDFERSLDQGFVGSNQFDGFHRSGGLPVFLQGFLRQVFDARSGNLLPMPSIEAIRAVRQLTLMYSKILLPCSPKRERKAVLGYVQCENELGILEESLFQSTQRCDLGGIRRIPGSLRGPDPVTFDGAGLRHIFRLSFGGLFAGMERELWQGCLDDFLPRHGPGATSDRLVGNQKFKQSEWPSRLEPYFPAGEFVFPSWRWFPNPASDHNLQWLDADSWVEGEGFRFIEPGEERPVRVVLVPKTLKTPRVIAIEPTAMQYAQQAVAYRFLKGWREDDYLSSFLGFDDQVPNQDLARQGSQDGSLATLDLSEASDRVSNRLVQFLLADTPLVAGLIDAVRSRKADVPGFGVLPLVKYASMGSALCFPIEAMVFLTLVLFGIQQDKGCRLTKKDLKLLLGKVRIFGDDIIVPSEYVDCTVRSLESFGFVVNRHKSFWIGKFRESCGKEYFDGHDISIVKFRRPFPTSRRRAEEVLSLVSFRNHLYERGFWDTCQWLDEAIVKLLDYFPIVESTSPVIGRISVMPYKADKICGTLHRPLVKGYVVSPKIPPSQLDGVPALTKWFISGHQIDPLHLERAGRPQRVDIKLRMATPY